MLIRLLALFICFPLVELVLLLRLADATSWWVTLTIVIGTAVIGSVLARREGMAAIVRSREALAAGRMPAREIQDGMMIALAGALLVMPGLLTDALGLLLLTPWGRRQVGAYFRRHYVAKFQVHDARLRPQSPPQDMPEADPDSWTRPQPSGDRFTVDSPSYGPKQRQAQ